MNKGKINFETHTHTHTHTHTLLCIKAEQSKLSYYLTFKKDFMVCPPKAMIVQTLMGWALLVQLVSVLGQ
jgi:hypothetical protein